MNELSFLEIHPMSRVVNYNVYLSSLHTNHAVEFGYIRDTTSQAVRKDNVSRLECPRRPVCTFESDDPTVPRGILTK